MLDGVLIPLLQRIRARQILGFLAAGVLFGTYGIGLWTGEFRGLSVMTSTRAEDFAALAELGVLFLIFTLGLGLSPARLWRLRYRLFAVSVG